jgi:curved DNA-binding protein CbpA
MPLAKLNKLKHTSYYRVLGVDSRCTALEVRRAYRREALRSHPDKQHLKVGGAAAAAATQRFHAIGEAYCVLGDPVARAAYDASRIGKYKFGNSSNSWRSQSGRTQPHDRGAAGWEEKIDGIDGFAVFARVFAKRQIPTAHDRAHAVPRAAANTHTTKSGCGISVAVRASVSRNDVIDSFAAIADSDSNSDGSCGDGDDGLGVSDEMGLGRSMDVVVPLMADASARKPTPTDTVGLAEGRNKARQQKLSGKAKQKQQKREWEDNVQAVGKAAKASNKRQRQNQRKRRKKAAKQSRRGGDPVL